MRRSQQRVLIPDVQVLPTLQMVALSDLPNAFALDTPQPCRSLRSSVLELGVLVPVVLVDGGETSTPRYRVADGRRRVESARLAGLTQVPAVIYPAGWTDDDILLLTANEQRRANPVGESRAAKRLLESGYRDQAIIAATAMRTRRWRHLLTLSSLHPDLLQAAGDGRMSNRAAQEAARLPRSAQLRLVTQLRREDRVRLRDVMELRADLRQAAAAKAGGQLTIDGRQQWKVEMESLLVRARAQMPDTYSVALSHKELAGMTITQALEWLIAWSQQPATGGTASQSEEIPDGH